MHRWVALLVAAILPGLLLCLLHSPSSQPPGTDPRPRVPLFDSESYVWIDPTPNAAQPSNCGNCHREIHEEWQASAHAISERNPRFLAAYNQLKRDLPDGIDVCASCHAPTRPADIFGGRDLSEAIDPARGPDGIHCDFCHKIQGPGTGEFGLTHGRFQLSLLRPGPDTGRQVLFGPLPDPVRRENVFSPFQKESRLCAACHEGTLFGVAVYSTWSEWQASPAGQAGMSCQSCHMRPTGLMRNMAPGKGGIDRDPELLGNHRFFDGSSREMLQRSLEVNVTGGIGWAEVQVTARNVGHALPTGFVDRNLVLTVEPLKDRSAVAVYHGPTLPAFFGGGEAGKPGRVYAKVLADRQGRRPAMFWNADPGSLIDTRLQPDRTDRMEFRFAPEADRIRVRLVKRRFWKLSAEDPPSLTDEQVIVDREFILNRSKGTR